MDPKISSLPVAFIEKFPFEIILIPSIIKLKIGKIIINAIKNAKTLRILKLLFFFEIFSKKLINKKMDSSINHY